MTNKPKEITYLLPNQKIGKTVICPQCGYERDVFDIDKKVNCGCSNSKCKYKINIEKNKYRTVVIERYSGI
ncbi:MAG: hypothetical protein IH841_09185 [Thaumarchaeota archaeon]|nr:hypothetical protein [Nitrososphaerota archaeon]